MIMLTRLGGAQFALNPDLIERADATPDTVVTLVGGTKYIVVEPLEELITRVREFRAHIIASAHSFEVAPPRGRTLRVVSDEAPDSHTTNGG